jgi:hypothetical protein
LNVEQQNIECLRPDEIVAVQHDLDPQPTRFSGVMQTNHRGLIGFDDAVELLNSICRERINNPDFEAQVVRPCDSDTKGAHFREIEPRLDLNGYACNGSPNI